MKSLKLALILALISSNYSVHAVDAEKPTVTVVISTKDIIDKSLRGKDIQKKINDEQAAVTTGFPAMEAGIKAKDAALAQQQNSYNEKVKSLEAKSKMISEEARNKEIDGLQDVRRQIEETTAERERLIRKFNEEAKRAEQRLETLYKKEMMVFESEIRDVIKSTKMNLGWDIIHPREALLDASDRMDKTSIIINKLDEAELKKQAEKKVANPAPAVKKAA